MTPLAQLLKAVESGHLLHGSRKRISFLQPRQARCESRDPERCQMGIYATSDIRVAVVKALLAKKRRWRRSWSSEYHGTESGFVIRGRNATLKPGYVHLLARGRFKQTEDDPTEFVSPVAIVPFKIIRIEPEIIKYLDIIIEALD